MDFHSEKLTENVAFGSPIPSGFKPLVEFPLVFFVSLTGTGATSTIEIIENSYKDLLVLPTRKYLNNKFIIPWTLSKIQKNETSVENRKLRFEYSKFFRKYNPDGIVGLLKNFSINTESSNIKFVLFDSLRHVKEIVHTNKKFNKPLYVLFKTNRIDRVKRISNKNYKYADIGKTDSYQDIFHIPGWNTTFTKNEMDKINQLILDKELSIENANNAIQIIIKEHQEYDQDKLAMKLFDIAHDTTLIIDGSLLTPQERAIEIYNWLTSKSSKSNEKN